MEDGGGIRAVLFDSGGVLIGPVGGRWNPRFDFEAIIARHSPGFTGDDVRSAIEAGDRFLHEHPAEPRDDYHRAMLRVLDVPASPELLAELNAPLDPTEVVEPFLDVFGVLDQLVDRGIRLAVVSDAWPELADLHRGIGLGRYFEVYAISAVLGCTKPDPRMYRHASDGLGLPPSACLFVDDDPALVEAAIELGYHGCALLRSGQPTTQVPAVSDLWGLLPLIEGS